MSKTNNLDLPYIMPAQAQKHVTHNEALRMLDAVVQLAVLGRHLANPPEMPLEGDRYIVAADAGGEWAKRDFSVATYQDGTWAFFEPNKGWLAWVASESVLVVWNGTAWVLAVAAEINPAPLIGVNATADLTNRLSVSANASLFNHEGNDHRLTINKAQPSDVASLIFQNGFSGRSEIGLTGDDNWHLKVSSDGSTWQDSVVVDRNSGCVALHQQTDFLPAVGGIWQRPARKSANAVNWRHIVNRNAYTDGSGVDGENYVNEVTALGWNLAETVGLADHADRSAFWDNWEYKYNVAGNYHHERHMESRDTTGKRNRFFSFSIPHDGATGSSHRIAVDDISWSTLDGNRVPVQWHLADGSADFGNMEDGFVLRFNTNNEPPLRQINSARTALIALPYIDASDRLVLTGRQQANPGTVPIGQSGISYNWNTGEIGHGASLFNISAATQDNAEFYAFYADARTNWRVKTGVRNTHASGFAQAEVIANGPAFFRAHDFTHAWSFGKTAAGDFFLGKGDPGAADVLTVDKSQLNVAFKRPPALPSYRVRDLPSARRYGAGAMVFVSDAQGGAVPAFSDGLHWRRMTNRSVLT